MEAIPNMIHEEVRQDLILSRNKEEENKMGKIEKEVF